MEKLTFAFRLLASWIVAAFLLHLALPAVLAETTYCGYIVGSCPDQKDLPWCESCECLPGLNGSPGGAGGCTGCLAGLRGRGMPEWWVSEPYLNLRLEDVPLWYNPSRGEPIEFHISYRNRGAVTEYTNVFGLGTNWSCSFRAYLMPLGGNSYRLHRGGAGVIDYVTNVPQTFDGSILVQVNNQHEIRYADGRSEVFGKSFYPTQTSNPFFFLTYKTNAAGATTTFHYSASQTEAKLLGVQDCDGRTNLLYYTNASFPNQITMVVDPFGRTNLLRYDELGYLTNVIDMGGLSSGFTYDVGARRDWITNLATPYGNTGFRFGGVDATSATFTTTGNVVNRFIEVTLPTGGKHLFAYRHEASDILPTAFTSGPDTQPYANTFDLNARQWRNSFYWSPLQHAVLSGTEPQNLGSADYAIARVRHWLSDSGGSPTAVLAYERAPSPDRSVEGHYTWFDYDGVSSPGTVGTSGLPLLKAWLLSDGSTSWFERTPRNGYGLVTEHVSTYTAPDGSRQLRTNTFLYAANQLDLIQHIGPSGDQVGSNYFGNPFHQPDATYDALNQETRFFYNTARQLTGVTRPAGGLTTTNLYFGSGASAGRLERTIDLEINRTNSFTYYSNGLVATQTDERGAVTTFFWDNLERLTGTGDARGTTTNLYTALDLVATRDRLGYWTTFDFNKVRQKVAETNANNVVTRYGYCECGSLHSVTNAWGTPAQLVTQFAYDYQGKLIYTYLPDATFTNFYNSLGQLTGRSDQDGIRYFGYNLQGLITNVSSVYGPLRSVLYDVEDRTLAVVDANGVTITNAFDKLGRLIARGHRDRTTGNPEHFGYSALGLTAYTNQLGFTNGFTYNAAGWKTSERNHNNELIQYFYDSSGNLTNLVDGKSQSTRWRFDPFGRLTNKLDQAGAVALQYFYDAGDRLTNRWSAAKGSTYYTHDAIGNVTFINYPSSPDVTLQYDALNRLTNMVDAVGTTKFAYTAGGLLWTEDGPFASDTVTNAYANRRRTGLALQQPAGAWTNTFAYDLSGRLTNVTSRAGSFGYQLRGASMLVQRLNLPNASQITNSYDALARLTGTLLKHSSGAMLNKHEYSYNAAHQRTNQVRADGSVVHYAYDPIGQLRVADSSFAGEDLGYSYDAAWNLNHRTNNGVPEAFTVDVKNQLTAAPSRTASFDANGNTTLLNLGTNGWMQFTYDDANQLVQVYYEGPNPSCDGASQQVQRRFQSLGGGPDFSPLRLSEFVYDGFGRLRARTDSTYDCTTGWTVTADVRYVYDGKRVIQERTSANAPAVSYTRGLDLGGSLEGAGGIGGLLARSHIYSSGNWLVHNAYHADGAGNITALINSSQQIVASYRYDPFGNLISQGGALAAANVYRFSSKEFHAHSGLSYFLHRWYDPGVQRWIHRDPLGEAGGINLYGFVGNSPANRVDPLGLTTGDDWLDQVTSGHIMTPLSPHFPGVDTAPFAEALCEAANTLLDPKEWQEALALIEPVPGLGDVATAANAAIDYARGDYALAAVGIAGVATPLVGPHAMNRLAAETGASRLRLNVFGTGEAPGFIDVSSNARFANGRPLTSGFGNGSASDIFIRNAPITGENTISEIMRLSQPGTRITLMQPASGFQGQALIDAFGNDASVNFIRTFPSQTVAPGVDMTILRMTVGGH